MLLARGVKNAVIKMGAQGVFLALESGLRQRVAGFVVEAVDTTAAGDAFNAGFAVGLLSGHDALGAARYASAVAAISVTRRGAQPSMPTGREVKSFLKMVR